MLILNASGVVEKNSVLKTERVRCLEFILITLKQGYGQHANRVFKEKLKVVVFGKDIEAMQGWILEGTWLEVTGEPSADAWMDRNNKEKAHGRIKVTAKTVTPCVFSIPEEQAQQRATAAAPDAPAPEDDNVPY